MVQGVFSDLYVVKGIGIGHEMVSVHLLETEFMHMADSILLTVAEAMSIEPPSPVFVLVGAALQYKLKVIRGNIPQGSFLLFFFLFSLIDKISLSETTGLIWFFMQLCLLQSVGYQLLHRLLG